MSEIDVSKCRFRDKFYGTCKATKDGDGECEIPCFDYKDCYYKQLQKLKAENEELKKYVEPCYNPKTGEIEGYLCNVTMGFVKGNEYKKALDEIEEIVNKHYATILEFYKAIKKIQQKIKEVKGNG